MIERNRQFGRVSRPAESGALIAGRTYKKRVGVGRAKQVATAFVRPAATASRPVGAPIPPTEVEQAAPSAEVFSDVLLDAVAVAIAEPVVSNHDEALPETPELTAITPGEAGEAPPLDMIDVVPPAPEDRVEVVRPAVRPARRRPVLRIAMAASIAAACLFGLSHYSDARLFTRTASVSVATPVALAAPASSASHAGEAQPSRQHVVAAPMLPVAVEPASAADAALPGFGPGAIIETAVLAPSPAESVTARAAALSELAEPAEAAAAKPLPAQKPPAKPVAAKPSTAPTAAKPAKPQTAAQQVAHAEPRPQRSRGAIMDFIDDLLP